MARADWRSASAYEDLRPLDAPAFAFEFLCRNPDFLTDQARLARLSRTRALHLSEMKAFAERWGVRFRRQTQPRTARQRTVDPTSSPERGNTGGNSRGPRRS
jgi:hypothetical protein